MDPFNPEEALQKVKREFGEHGGVAPSLSRSSTFTVLEPRTMPEIFEGLKGPEKGGCYLYSRHFNPTVNVLARYLAAIEDTEFALCTASGMAAISCALLQICRAGDHIVASDTVYGGTHALLAELLPEIGIRTTFVDITDSAAVAAAMQKRTRVVYTEGIGNPTLRVADLPLLSTLAHDAGAWLVVDNTFSPLVITPSRLGADVAIHSLTKFINGASDLLGGVICADRDFIYRLMDLHTGRAMLLGPSMDPRAAFDVIQRIPHLPLRMREHCRFECGSTPDGPPPSPPHSKPSGCRSFTPVLPPTPKVRCWVRWPTKATGPAGCWPWTAAPARSPSNCCRSCKTGKRSA